MLLDRARTAAKRVPVIVTGVDTAAHLARMVRSCWFDDVRAEMEAAYAEHRWDFGGPRELERHRRLLDLVAHYAGELGTLAVLEVGCAEGVFTERLAAACRSVMAIDVAQAACRRARERLASSPNVAVLQLDVSRTVPPASFDVVFLMDTLECIPRPADVRKALLHVLAALRPGGLLAVSECMLPPSMEGSWWARLLAQGGDGMVRTVSRHRSLRLLAQEDDLAASGCELGYVDHVLAVWQKQS
ncbi:MAG: class I SAM-dependent methyltransferase [Chloroflexi bacterium]|nr:class I SAM-dependent methyltransferase [Chloroflexota bacterium]